MATMKFNAEPAYEPSKYTEGVTTRQVFGGPEELELFEMKMPAGNVTEPHCHDEDEIMYVLSGSVSFGRRLMGPGASVMIPKFTLYSFTAGPDGVHLANFRPRKSESPGIPRAEFMRMNEAAAAAN